MYKEAAGLAIRPTLVKDKTDVVNSKHLAVDDRLKAGWAAEDEIIATLERFLGQGCFTPTGHSTGADKYDKIDGYLKYPSGRRFAVQIKGREGGKGAQAGKDIIVEVLKDFDRNVIGRDMKGSAQLYICRTIDGKIIIADADKVKGVARKLMDEWENQGEHFDDRGWFRGTGGSLYLGRGDSPARYKVVAFIPPGQFGGDLIEGIPCKLVPSLKKVV